MPRVGTFRFEWIIGVVYVTVTFWLPVAALVEVNVTAPGCDAKYLT